ncbi:hypothetical protein Q4Q54_03715 [Shewanella sp. SP2S2-4]|uniref:hypothetical protein n=1 Tax=Shewanella sp. SP2S2-4 TaxID=3063539 RepID=UPI0028901705|nr:hypothetical protein [Shewanella sp. SP2S2-4]MDT3272592.1 hypothetical protein [Shewanella sp. SP2S2-4]
MATVNEQPAFNSDLFQQLLQPENLHRAWRQVKANNGAAGIDGMTKAKWLRYDKASS